MKNALIGLFAAFAAVSSLADVTRDTEWYKIPDKARVGEVVDVATKPLSETKREKTDLRVWRKVKDTWKWTAGENCPDDFLDFANAYNAPQLVYHEDDGGVWGNVNMFYPDGKVRYEIVLHAYPKNMLTNTFTFIVLDHSGNDVGRFKAVASRASATDETMYVIGGDSTTQPKGENEFIRIVTTDVARKWIDNESKEIKAELESHKWHTSSLTNDNGKSLVNLKDTVLTHPNGVNWTQVTGVSGNLYAVAYGNGRFIVCDSTNVSKGIYYSDNGKTWYSSNKKDGKFLCATYGNGKFVAGTYGEGIWYSSDGRTWYKASSYSGEGYIRAVAFGNGMFVAGIGNALWYSNDGVNWTQSAIEGDARYAITFGNGMFVASGSTSNGGIDYSYDGINWTKVSFRTDFSSLTYGNGRFVAGTSNIGIYYSDDGINWTQSNMKYGIWECIGFGNGRFIAGSRMDYGIYYSDDGINWTAATTDSYYWRSVTYGNGMFLISRGGYLGYSEDITEQVAPIVQRIKVNGEFVNANKDNEVQIIIPTKVSAFENDVGYLKTHQDISGKADRATTLAGYGITDGATKNYVDGKISSTDESFSNEVVKVGYSMTNELKKAMKDELDPVKWVKTNEVVIVKSHAMTTYSPTFDDEPPEQVFIKSDGTRNFEIYFPDNDSVRELLPIGFDVDIEGDVKKIGKAWTEKITKLPAILTMREPEDKTLLATVQYFD